MVILGITAIILGCSLVSPPRHAQGGVGPAAIQSSHRLFDRVFIIVLENTDYDRALLLPFLRDLTTMGALFTEYHAVAHPSYLNYVAMVAGSTLGVGEDSSNDLEATNLADLLESASVSWKVYAENLPGPCFTGSESRDGLYVRRHEPYISFRNIQTNRARCERIVDATQLQADLAKNALPEYSLYVPNLQHSGHDMPLMDPRAWIQALLGRNPGAANAEAWLKGFLSPLLQDPHFTRGTLVVVTFDENDGARGNQIYTVFIGPMVRPGVTNTNPYTHYSLLRMIEDNYQLGTLGREDATAAPICCVWKE